MEKEADDRFADLATFVTALKKLLTSSSGESG